MHGETITRANVSIFVLQQVDQRHADFAILDIGMPGLNGYDLARRLRSLGFPITLIALTGWGQESDLKRARGGL
jgi:CheY-like chemotaxis protein